MDFLESLQDFNLHRSTPTEMSWDLNSGGQIYWDPTSNSNAQTLTRDELIQPVSHQKRRD